MKNAQDLDLATDDSVGSDEGEPGQHQLPDIWHLRGSAHARERFQLFQCFENLSDQIVCEARSPARGVVLMDCL